MPDQDPAPYTADHPAVALFAALDEMAKVLTGTAAMFSDITAAFATQVALAKAMMLAREENPDG